MRTLKVIAIVVLVVLSLFFIVFAQIQRGYAAEVISQNATLDRLAEEKAREAEMQREIALRKEKTAVEAVELLTELQEELELCKKNQGR